MGGGGGGAGKLGLVLSQISTEIQEEEEPITHQENMK